MHKWVEFEFVFQLLYIHHNPVKARTVNKTND